MRALVSIGLTSLVLIACGGSTPPPSSAPTTPSAEPSTTTPATTDAGAAPTAATAAPAASSPPPDTGTPKERLMKEHFRETAAMRDAVVHGKLTDVAAPAKALSQVDSRLGEVPASWRPALESLQGAANRIGQSPDLPAAAAAIADIGLACGSCHRATSGPKVKVEAPPPVDNSSMASRMQRHVWASERFWEAIYAPSDASWKAGVDALGKESFPKEVLDKGGVHARSAASRFTALVASANTKKKPEDRAKVYASMLEQCAACHIATQTK